MDDLNCISKVSPDQQRRVTEMVLQGIKDIFPSLPSKLKYSVSLKKDQKGDGNWEDEKEILGWILNSEKVTFQLPPCCLKELKSLLTISPSQRRLPVSNPRSLIGKLRSMHLAVPGSIGHFFFIEEALTKVGMASKAYLSKALHRKIAHWQRLSTNFLARPCFLAEVVPRLPTALGFCDALGVGAGGVWINPDGTGKNFVWRLQWLEDIVADLVTWENSCCCKSPASPLPAGTMPSTHP